MEDNEQIDYVVTYCDSTKAQWQKQYKKYVIDAGLAEGIDMERFDSKIDLLKYSLRGVDKFMPWIGNLHLVVSSKTQVPNWIDKSKVHIVTHKDIFPKDIQKDVLPTFNSNTIEKFLWNILGLTEKFVYGNDDFLICKPLEKEWFFVTDFGKDKLEFHHSISNINKGNRSYMKTLANSTDFLYNEKVMMNPMPPGLTIRASHTHAPRPNFKSVLEEMWNNHRAGIIPTLNRIRSNTDLATLEVPYYLYTGQVGFVRELPKHFSKYVFKHTLNNIFELLALNYVVGLNCEIPEDKVEYVKCVLDCFYQNKSRWEK